MNRLNSVIPLCVALVMFVVSVRAADILPAERDGYWQQGVNVGVVGGIPGAYAGAPAKWPVVFTVDASVWGTGLVDCQAYLQGLGTTYKNSYGAILLPAGVYTIVDQISWNGSTDVNNVVFRGEVGPSGELLTTIKKTNGSGNASILYVGNADSAYWNTAKTVVSASKNNATIVLNNVSGVVASTSTSEKIALMADVAPDWAGTTAVPYSNPGDLFFFRIVSVDSGTNSVVIDPPSPHDFITPDFIYQGGTLLNGISQLGFEDMILDGDGISSKAAFYFGMSNCWFKNVRITNVTGGPLGFHTCVQLEVFKCVFDGVVGTGAGKEGVDLIARNTGILVHNNLFDGGGYPAVTFGDQNRANILNVMAYNFDINGNVDSPAVSASYSTSHGNGNRFSLVEGNIGTGLFCGDGYQGWATENAVMRNWFTAYRAGRNELIFAIRAARWSVYNTYGGNVLGSTYFRTDSMGLYNPTTEFSNTDFEVVYQLGYPNLGNNGFNGTWPADGVPTNPPYYPTQYLNFPSSPLSERDVNVEGTTIKKHNWNGKDQGINASEALGSDTIRDSYVYASKPSWFGSLTWPAFNAQALTPGNTDYARIPAGYRYVYGVWPDESGSTATVTNLNVGTIRLAP